MNTIDHSLPCIKLYKTTSVPISNKKNFFSVSKYTAHRRQLLHSSSMFPTHQQVSTSQHSSHYLKIFQCLNLTKCPSEPQKEPVTKMISTSLKKVIFEYSNTIMVDVQSLPSLTCHAEHYTEHLFSFWTMQISNPHHLSLKQNFNL